MKKTCFFISILMYTVMAFSQNIAITDDDGYIADPSAMLDVNATDKGMLIPRLTTAERVAIINPATGLMVFDSDGKVFYYYNGTTWLKIDDIAWSLTGNSGTIDGTNFIGTTDNVPLNFKVNNLRAGRIEPLTTTANTFFGYTAGISNAGGQYNTANGYSTLFSNTVGCSNAALGFQALYANLSGRENTASGMRSLMWNTSGNYNTANGYVALAENISGSKNTANGYFALYNNVAGSNATAIGASAMYYANNTSTPFTNYNVAIGFEALRGSTSPASNTGNYNTAIGYQALWSNTTGINNTATGYKALYSNTIGWNNVANGWQTLINNTTGDNNIAIGFQALYTNISGGTNIACGWNALHSNTGGSSNIATGQSTLYANTGGNNNIASGDLSLYNNTTGNNNVAIGIEAGFTNNIGSSNVFLGYKAGFNETGSNKLYIANSDINPPLIYGDFSTGNVGIATNSPNARLDLGTSYGTNGEKFLIYNDDSSGPLAGTKMGFYIDRFSLQNNLTTVFTTAAAFPGSFIIASKDYGNTTFIPRLTILGQSGNIGIGEMNPNKRLHIKANATDDGIVLERASVGANTRIQFQNEGGVNQSAIIYEGLSDDLCFLVQGTNDVLRLRYNGNVGIGISDPKSKLQVNGSVQIADDSDTASADKVGTIRYRADSNNSYAEMCMQTSAATYAWIIIKQNIW